MMVHRWWTGRTSWWGSTMVGWEYIMVGRTSLVGGKYSTERTLSGVGNINGIQHQIIWILHHII